MPGFIGFLKMAMGQFGTAFATESQTKSQTKSQTSARTILEGRILDLAVVESGLQSDWTGLVPLALRDFRNRDDRVLQFLKVVCLPCDVWRGGRKRRLIFKG
jgi:hypothetical protein